MCVCVIQVGNKDVVGVTGDLWRCDSWEDIGVLPGPPTPGNEILCVSTFASRTKPAL